ncbi:MAG: DUF349 domain-containing protein [Microbacteriaceae bacterium]|nr:DUF349 domain-containing protein [Microbacteriaceae bacterium]
MSSAKDFGKVDAEGNVFVVEGSTERRVGQVPGMDAEAALAIYVLRFEDLAAQVRLLEQRIKSGADAASIEKSFTKLEADLKEPAAVGDLASLRERLAKVQPSITQLRAAKLESQKVAAAAALVAREAIVLKAEAILAKDASKIIWKTASTEMAALFEEWQQAQKSGPRPPKSEADLLWKRFSATRTKFEASKRAFFAQVDAASKVVKAKKLELVSQAEALVAKGADASLDYRKLLETWKASGRSTSKSDDALWERFKAAGDAIYAARSARDAEQSVGHAAALEAKLAILKEAQAIDPAKDLAAAKRSLQDIQKRWEAAGRVAKDKVRELDDKLRTIERAVRDAESEQWRKSDPATKARTDSVLTQLEESIAKLQVELVAAKTSKDAKKIAAAEEALAARESWLKVVAASK